MLKLLNIKKIYKVADTEVEALKGIDLCFRKNEFVSILGPSGCGKTTMLNIIGGLDKYTSGDLFISGRSTKEFNDKDWDVYRNHRIGFVFQSYNLIPHQTILGNVELALTIAGMSKEERIKRAKKAIDRVGLKNQYYKKPNQLSGGQCQRVAIARALVNEPEILLADEPTGALDTQTSIQIMDLIKEISKEKLVIMVTHNPDLAYQYSTRIVKLLDGNVLEDSNPYSPLEEEEEIKKIESEKDTQLASIKVSKEKAKMSLWTAFKLSARNLHSKFKRTFMVALAGCIGIVGVSTVLAVSNGVQGYINEMENDMLSGNPVYITTSSLDYSSIMGGGISSKPNEINPEKDRTQIFINSLVQTLVNMNGVTSTNKITDEYMKFLSKMPEDACELIQYEYGYSIAPNIYTDFKTGDGIVHNMSVSAIQATYASVLNNVKELADYSSMISSVTVMTELPSNAKYLENQYEILYLEEGMTFEDVINDETSLIAVASKNSNTLNDLELAEYGYFSQELFLNYCYKIGNSELYSKNPALQLPETISYETLAKKKFTWYPNDIVFTKGDTDEKLGDKFYASAYSDGTLNKETDAKYDNYKRAAFEKTEDCVDLNVKCVVRLKDELSYGCLSSGGLYYTNALSTHMRDCNYDSEICKSARDSGETLYNIELGYNFKFDGNSSKEFETYYLTSGNGAIMDYIAQFMGGGSSDKKVSSYSLSKLGGSKHPESVYFYCNNFEQKNKLTEYLDVWNENNDSNLYKVDTNGFYVGKTTNENNEEILVYFYHDPETNKYFKVNITTDGFASDYKGNQYKLIVDDETDNSGFYLKLSDTIGEKFTMDGQIKISDNISINAYSLASYIIFEDEFNSSNVYFNFLEEVENKGGYLYRYENSDGEYEYLMKLQNQSFYKVALDKNANVISPDNGYTPYVYDEENDKFYSVTYEKTEDTYILNTTTITKIEYNNLSEEEKPDYKSKDFYYKKQNMEINGSLVETWVEIDSEEYNQLSESDRKTETKYIKEEYTFQEGTYVVKTEEVEENDVSKLFVEKDVYNYANVVKNPKITINGEEYTLDTKGFYIDLTTAANNININTVHVDTDSKVISLLDYSGIDFYYKDLKDNEYTYHYVDYREEDGKSYIYGKDISQFLSDSAISNYNVDGIISDKYLLNDDGSLQAITPSYSDTALTVKQMLDLKVIGDELTDLSILEIDDSLKINYTDMIGLIISMVNTLIQIITYALIAFTALSLVVSTVMIGIITYVSVVERTKEIGVIRSLGGRKKDVSHLFNAETLIIGTASGVLGIAITYLLSLFINLIIGHFAGIYTIAALPWYQAIIMILISILLTTISGLIPAKSAAKKDPVVALRTE